ncbi:hypothetical protein BDA96_10G301900 [Sorghum bicolor]|uniref:Uncharacterized protein n=1 Tax=Sorghum bicolor TaxID=4558 RepID=A0A921U2K0_SORBI|nr:hypothetical protein BDA96_10G301900 [Sorghum bicolor]
MPLPTLPSPPRFICLHAGTSRPPLRDESTRRQGVIGEEAFMDTMCGGLEEGSHSPRAPRTIAHRTNPSLTSICSTSRSLWCECGGLQ